MATIKSKHGNAEPRDVRAVHQVLTGIPNVAMAMVSDDAAEMLQKQIREASALRQLLTHVPDMVITCDHGHAMPNVTHVRGVCMFADISGFTSLCETYGNLGGTDASCGTEKLTATLNTYIGKIVEDILVNGGDVLKFAGDALLAMWKCNDAASDLTLLVNKAIICSLAIQEECDNYLTDVGVLLRVKIALSIGKMNVTYVGVPDSKQFDLTGQAVEDVNGAEKWATPGSIILDRMAWESCEQSLFYHEVLEDGYHFKVSGIREQAVQSDGNGDLIKTEIALMSMAGILSTAGVALAIPPVSRKIFGPHVGNHFTKTYPNIKLSGIYKRSKKKENATSKKISSDNDHDPGHRTDVCNLLNDQEIEDLRAYVSKPVLSKIDHDQDLQWLSEMRQVSVLFINMVLPKKGDLSAWALQQAFEIIYENVRNLGGNVNKVFSFDKGCTFLVVFGLPGEKHEDDQARALKAGHRIIETLHTIREITHEAIGVTTGRAFCGVVGHRDRHEYTVIGRKVNMAARLMVNYPGILSCDNETYLGAKSKLKKEDFLVLPHKPLKGIADPGEVREYNKNHDREIEDDETEYPILGREKECKEMKKLLHTVTTDERQAGLVQHMVIIEGEAGIGKTRLIEEFMDMAEDENFRVDYVEADMAHVHTPFYVVQMLISILLELDMYRTPSEKEHALREHVTDEHLRESLCLLNDLLGTHVPQNPKFVHMDSSQVTEHFHQLLFGIVHQVAVDQPCLFAVDNAQFIDRESWDFLEDLQKDSHAVLVLALRPFSAASPPCKSAVRMINNPKSKKFKLTGLNPELMSSLACQFMDVMYIPKELDTILREKSHGVPSWCEQLIKEVLLSKIIAIVSESEAFRDECVADSLLFGPLDGLRDKYYELSSQIISDEVKHARPESPFLRSKTPALPNLTEEESHEVSLSGTQLTDSRKGSLFTKLLINNQEKAQNQLESSARSTTFAAVEAPKHDSSRRSSLAKDRKESTLKFEKPQRKEPPKFNRNEFVPASLSAMPKNTYNVCVVSPGVQFSNILIPESVKDMVLARVDRMSPTEQVTLKCASILGMQFSRDLVEALVPVTCKKSLDVILYTLVRDGILECASLAAQHQLAHNHHGFYDYNDPAHAHHHTHHHHHHHHHNVATSLHAPVLCGCYADEGNMVLNLTSMMTPNGPIKHCLFYKFSNIYVQETTYDVWLEDQRKGLHEKAAMFLESQAHKCRACGGGGFVPGMSSLIDQAPVEDKGKKSRRATIAHSTSAKRRKAEEMRKTVQTHGAFSSRAHERDVISRASQAGIPPDLERKFAENLKRKDRSSSIRSNDSKLFGGRGSQQSLLTRLATKGKVKPNDDFASDDDEITKLLGDEWFGIDDEDEAMDIKKCRCAEVLASIFPQLVEHWRAAGNKIKTFRYLTESGAAALTSSANMQALSYLYDVRGMFEEEIGDGESIATLEEKARVENLIGQALFHMNRLDESLLHFNVSLKLLNKEQPNTRIGVIFRIRKESLRHYLHVFFPGYYMESAGDNSTMLTEQARCLGHLSHVYHALHENDKSLMAALQELNAAEEADENLHELLVAYGGVIECCHLVGWTSWADRYETIGLQRSENPSLYSNPDDLVTVFHLYCVSLSFRLATANIKQALQSGNTAMLISNKLNDSHMKIECLPLYIQALLLNGKIEKSFELLKNLNYISIEEEDAHGKALYMCGCFDLLLDAGQQVESVSVIENFLVQATADATFCAEIVPKFYLSACLASWYARIEDWDKAETFLQDAIAHEPTKLEDFMSVVGLLRIVETELLHLRVARKNKTTKQDLRKKFHKLKDACRHFTVLRPRTIHLQAYKGLIFNKNGRARSLLKKSMSQCDVFKLYLELQALKRDQNTWFGNKNPANFSDGNYTFSLPAPRKTKGRRRRDTL